MGTPISCFPIRSENSAAETRDLNQMCSQGQAEGHPP